MSETDTTVVIPEGKFYTAFSRSCRTVFRTYGEAKISLPKHTFVREFNDNASAMSYMMFGTYAGVNGELMRDEMIYSANEFYSTQGFVDKAPVCSCIVAVSQSKDDYFPHARVIINDPAKTSPYHVDVPLDVYQIQEGGDHASMAAFQGIHACLEMLYGPASDIDPLGGLLNLDQQALIVIGKSKIVRRFYKNANAYPYESEVKKRLNTKSGGKENGKFLRVRLVESDRVPLYLTLTAKMDDQEKKKEKK